MKNTHLSGLMAGLLSLGLGGAAQASPIFVYQDGAFLGSVVAYSGGTTTAANWNLNQAPTIGPGQADNSGRLFFYAGSDGLSFNMLFNNGDGDNENGSIELEATVAASAGDPVVKVADDGGAEFWETATNNTFHGKWQWSWGADGGAFGALQGDWSINVDLIANGWSPSHGNEVVDLAVYSGGGSPVSLSLDLSKDILLTNIAIPEPTTLAILGLGLVGVGLGNRKRLS